ncbi:MAG: Rid family hydrolase [Candidatus Promineifilaceae bacterium]|nr:Rid family hydrolase [Candidatus Promineifilaceae bacterium]
MAARTRQVYENMSLALAEAGASFSDVVEFTTYHAVGENQGEHLLAINELSPPLFPDEIYPAHTDMFVGGLYLDDFLIEAKTIAVLHRSEA